MKKNPLTEIAGGYTLVIMFKDGSAQTQHNIKYPKKYADAVMSNKPQSVVNILNITTNETLYSAKA